MQPVAVLGAVGVALLGLAGCIVLEALGQAATDHAVEALWRRPSLAERRGTKRGLMRCGVGVALLAASAALVWVAAATSGRPEDADDARLWGGATAVLSLLAAVLLGVWWRKSGDGAPLQ